VTGVAHPADVAYDRLAQTDPAMAALIGRFGRPDPFAFNPILSRVGDDRFRALMLSITSQQISSAAAWAIFDRVIAALSQPAAENRSGTSLDGMPDPASVLALGIDRLRALGLSRAKALAVTDLADAVETGRVDLAHMPVDDEAAITLLSTVRGIGRWSAQVFLIMQLRRPDILPAGDLGIRKAVQRVWQLPEVPSIREVQARGLAWSPYRTYAAVLLWNSL
jgi:DNA-3-methyladenine glycosylase II